MKRFLLSLLITVCILTPHQTKAEPITVGALIAAVTAGGIAIKEFIDAKKHCKLLCNRHTCAAGIGNESLNKLRDGIKKLYPEKNIPLTSIGTFCKNTCQDISKHQIVVTHEEVVSRATDKVNTDKVNADTSSEVTEEQLTQKFEKEVEIEVKQRFGQWGSIEQCVIAFNQAAENANRLEIKKPKSVAVYNQDEYDQIITWIKTNKLDEIVNFFYTHLDKQ